MSKRSHGSSSSKLQREESVNADTNIILYEPKEESVIPILHCSIDVSTSALERAQEVQASLSSEFPSFVKCMLKSHISGGFSLALPSKFCLAYLPKHDDTVVLEDENGNNFKVKYLAGKPLLSGGWAGFSKSHGLLEGDVLVFHLIDTCKFKIYIVRERRLTNVDRATNLLTLSSHAEPVEPVEHLSEEAQITETRKKESLALVPVADQYENNNISDAQVMDGIEISESQLSFKDVKGIQDFKVQINGLIIDSEIPIHLRKKYYELCCSQNMFLHDNLISGLNSKLVAGAIYETINIADAIRVVKPSIDPNEMESWDRTLKAFEDLGMAVGFLRTRIHKLSRVSHESQAKIQLKRYERSEAEKEMCDLKMKLSDVEKRIKLVDLEIDELVKNKKLDAVFKEVADAPW